MRKLLALLLVAALAFGGWYLASPWWAMKSLSDAAQAGDVEAIADKVDMAALRASAADQVTEAIRQQQGTGGLLDGWGGVVAERVGREAMDRALTPEGMSTVVATGALAAPFLPARLRNQSIAWDVEREGIDHFRSVGTFEDGTPGPTLIFEREGIGWVLTGFELPEF
ncbi:MAG: DUF2939 domain-containing protein [Alteraurantiacibacter sp.]